MSNPNEADADARPHAPLAHGSRVLPAVTVDTYNEELRDDDGFVGDRAGRRAFRVILADWRERLKEHGEDPLGDTPTEDISKAKLDKMMATKVLGEIRFGANLPPDELEQLVELLRKMRSASG